MFRNLFCSATKAAGFLWGTDFASENSAKQKRWPNKIDDSCFFARVDFVLLWPEYNYCRSWQKNGTLAQARKEERECHQRIKTKLFRSSLSGRMGCLRQHVQNARPYMPETPWMVLPGARSRLFAKVSGLAVGHSCGYCYKIFFLIFHLYPCFSARKARIFFMASVLSLIQMMR